MNEDYMFEEEVNDDTQLHFTQPIEEPKETIEMAVAAFILGMISLVFFLTLFNVFTSIVAIILAIIFLARHKKKGRGFAITGILASIISIVLCIVSWSLIFSNIDNMMPMYEDILKLYDIDADIDIDSDIDHADSIKFEINNNSSDDLDVDDTL